jgi:glyoxylase-like metal-dependent hydrolase (beta-lactamase superfamily II)
MPALPAHSTLVSSPEQWNLRPGCRPGALNATSDEQTATGAGLDAARASLLRPDAPFGRGRSPGVSHGTLRVMSQNSKLIWQVFVSPVQLVVEDDLPPNEQCRYWPPISATLISGERDAVLVDPLMTIAQARVLADWVAASGKRLTTVYVTHGHGDHFFGLGSILARFPAARGLATPGVVEVMNQQASRESLASFYEKQLPRQIPDGIRVAEPLCGDRIDLEGHELVVIEVGHADTDASTCLWVPEIALVVAGDVAYNRVHLHLGESDARGRSEWIKALDTIEALEPRAVIAGHKQPQRPDSPSVIDETRGYIQEFDRTVAGAPTSQAAYEKMVARYPDWLNRGALWSSAKAAMS